MKQLLVFASLSFLTSLTGFSQSESKHSEQEAVYTKTISERSRKIVAVLGMKDSIKALEVQSMITAQYRNLNKIHTDRDQSIKSVKARAETKEVAEEAIKKLEGDASAKLNKLHGDFVTTLSSHLTEEQIIQVKDGLTYNVVPITYKGYLDMLPNLSAVQKGQIMTWLVEAREHAMDAETSEKKHGWFGKYKGRINNYLSAAGYDLKKESEAWHQRIKKREELKTASGN